MTVAPGKICVVCHKDVSNAKRVKDAKGRYYCAACHEAMLHRQPAAAVSAAGGSAAGNAAHAAPPRPSVPSRAPAAPTSPAPPPIADDGEIPMVDPPPTRRPTPQPVSAKIADAPKSKPAGAGALPEFCPNCGAKVFPGRRLCFKCNRDVTQMDKLLAIRAEASKGPSAEEKFATWFGYAMRGLLALVIIAAAVIGGLGLKTMFMPGGLWDNYPKTREGAVREFLGDIAQGTEKSYDKAFMLISFRERNTGKPGEDQLFTRVFRQMHDDFVSKYGADWLSKIMLENLGSNDGFSDDEVDFKLTLGEDSYIIATQVQIDMTRATANMSLPRLKKPVYNEDGVHHFGILDVDKYKVHEKRHMIEMVGPGQPADFGLPEAPPPQ